MGVGAGLGVAQQALVKAFLAEKPLLRRFWPGFLRILEFLEKTPQKRNSATRYPVLEYYSCCIAVYSRKSTTIQGACEYSVFENSGAHI